MLQKEMIRRILFRIGQGLTILTGLMMIMYVVLFIILHTSK